jgi:hypothetical protein
MIELITKIVISNSRVEVVTMSRVAIRDIVSLFNRVEIAIVNLRESRVTLNQNSQRFITV